MAGAEVVKIKTKRAAQMDHPGKVLMGTRLEPMVPQESAAEAAKVWTRNLNAARKAVGRAIPEPSICRNPKCLEAQNKD